MSSNAIQQEDKEIFDTKAQNFDQLVEEHLRPVDDDTTIGVTGKPRTTREIEMPVDNATRYFVGNTEATVKVHQESEEKEVDRGLGTPGWKFPSARDNRNTDLQFYKGPDESILSNVAQDVDIHVIGDFASYTGHEQGMEHRQEEYGVESLSNTDLDAEVVIASTSKFPYFTDIASDSRPEGDFDEYLQKAEEQIQQIGEGYETTIVAQDPLMYEDTEFDTAPGQFYIVGKKSE